MANLKNKGTLDYSGELPAEFMDKVASAITSGTPAQQAALVNGLKNILNPDQQSQLLDYFGTLQSSASTDATAVDPLTVATDFGVGTPSGDSNVGYRTPEEFGLSTEGIPGLTSQSGSLGELNYTQAFDELMKQTMAVESDYLQGKIPEDVFAQIEKTSAETALTSGIGPGQAARNLTARDLGLTSLQLQQTGAQLANQTASIIAQQQQFNSSLSVSIDEFNKQNALAVNNYMSTVRQQDLTEAQMYYANQQFNVNAALELNKMIVQMVQFGQQLQFMYATTPGVEGEVDTSALQSDVQNVINDLSKLIT